MVDNNKIIHLFITNKCTHNCKNCCNKQYDIDKIPVITVDELKYADTVLLTGGEPFMLVDYLEDFAKMLKHGFTNIKQLYVYTCGDSLYKYLQKGKTLDVFDGVNIAPKNKYDAECTNSILKYRKDDILSLASNRLYIFPEMNDYIPTYDLYGYSNLEIIHRKWQEEFKPHSGIFRRLPILFE